MVCQYNNIQELKMQKVWKDIDDIQYIQCQQQNHQNSQLNFICIDSECKNYKLACIHCIDDKHSQHSFLLLKQYLKKVYTNAFSYQNSQNSLMWIQKIELFKLDCLQELKSMKQKICETIDTVINQISLQYQMITNYIKNMCSSSKLVNTIIGFHKKYQNDIKIRVNSLQMQQNMQNNMNNNNNINEIYKKITKIINRLAQFAPIQKQQIDGQNYNYNVINLSQRIKSTCTAFINKCKNGMKIIQKVNEEWHKKAKVQQFKINKNQIETWTKIKYNKFEWEEQPKSSPFKITNNKVQRSVATGVQRFIISKQSLKQYITKKKPAYWLLKINKLIGWIGIGICIRETIVTNNYKFNYNALNHGSYMISSNGYTWSNKIQADNSSYHNFNFATGDYIVIQLQYSNTYNNNTNSNNKLNFYICKQFVIVNNIKNNEKGKVNKNKIISIPQASLNLNKYNGIGSQANYVNINIQNLTKTYTLNVQQSQDYYPCVNLCSVGDSVEIIQ